MVKRLVVILGDQLSHNLATLKQADKANDLIVMAEVSDETGYVPHHPKKIVLILSAMRKFAAQLRQEGWHVAYTQLEDAQNSGSLSGEILRQAALAGTDQVVVTEPAEWRVIQAFEALPLHVTLLQDDRFIASHAEFDRWAEGRKALRMEYFYRDMRKKNDILMINAKDPEGGKWNFDKSNRQKWKGKPEIPHERGFRKDVSDLVEEIKNAGVETFGSIESKNYNWPTTREDSLSVLNYFCKNLLVHFGDYQDALHTDEAYLFHSRLSFSMNTKMLSPKEVINSVLDYYYDHKDEIDISQVEGFIRQILGWREYMRGIYWKEMPGYRRTNKLRNQNKLAGFYWDAKTKMNCLHHAIKNSLENAYAHHIQRLMITGNYALLTETHPDEVDQWYLGIYIDAIEWVEITNTRGMSQFADGGIVATKPYVSSGSYINKMSNYCKGCSYDKKQRTGENACPFNSLYWNFLDDKREELRGNNRMGMMYNLLGKINPEELARIKERAYQIMENPDAF